MKATIFGIITLILLINFFTYELTIQSARNNSITIKKQGDGQITKDIPKCLEISLTGNLNNMLKKQPGLNKLLLLELRKSKEEIYKIFDECGFSRAEFDSFVKVANKYIKKGNLTYHDMFMLLNYENYTDHFFYKGYREGINSLNPDSMKNKIVMRVTLDSFDTKNTCQYFNAHKSFLFKTYDEAIEIGLFKTAFSQRIFWNALDWTMYKLENYYFNPDLRFHKEKILGPYDEEKFISMGETKKGN